MAGVGRAINESGPAVAGQVVQLWSLSRFRPYDRNPRKNDHAVERVAAAIREFGFKVPVLARSNGELIDGHLRLKAATFLGLDSIPVLLADDLTDAQVRAFRISVNRMAELAEWDTDLLASELDELAQLDVPVEMAGWTGAELEELEVPVAAAPVLADPEEVPEVKPVVTTRMGDLWLLGGHRLLCGDSTKAEDVARVMNGEKAALIHADPPYFGKVEAEWDNDFEGYEGFLDFLSSVFTLWAPQMLERGTSGWWCAPDFAWHIEGRLRQHFAVFNHIVWYKGRSLGTTAEVAAMRRWRPRSERLLLCEAQHSPDALLASFTQKTAHIAARKAYASIIDRMMGWRDVAGLTNGEIDRCLGTVGMAGHYFGRSQWSLPTREAWAKLRPLFQSRGVDIGEFDAQRREFDAQRREFDAQRREFDAQASDNFTDVWEGSAPLGEERHGHPTPKPLGLISKLVSAHARPGDLVAEPFLGSGTTLIAAEQLGRKCYGLELDPAYCDVIVRRWEGVTGKQATLDATGETFAAVAAKRVQEAA